MSEIKDMVLPMLQGIQTEQRALRPKVDAIGEHVAQTKDDMDLVKGYVTYHMGLTTQAQSDIAEIRKEIAAPRSRIAALEGRG